MPPLNASRSSLIRVTEKEELRSAGPVPASAAFAAESSVEETTTLGLALAGQATGSPSFANATLLTTSTEHAKARMLARIRRSALTPPYANSSAHDTPLTIIAFAST